MTSERDLDRDLDRRLGAWFADRAASIPPDDLLARSVARVQHTRQRAVWQFPLLALRTPTRVGPAAVPAWAVLLLVALVATVIALAGSRILQPHDTAIVPPLATSGPTTAPSIVETPAPSPVESRPQGTPAEIGMFATLHEVDADGDVAWVVTDTAIYRTVDAGTTWRAVQPQGYAWQQDEGIVDATTAYIAVDGGSAVAVTHDGGATWSSTPLGSGDAGEPVLSFESPTHAWATFVDASRYDTPQGTGLLIYATTDGGATWTGPVQATQPHMVLSFNKLEPDNHSFLVEAAGKADGKPYHNAFFASADGGTTWTTYTFPINSISPKADMKALGAILREPSGRFLVEFSAVPDGPGQHPNGIYESTDDTAAWRLLFTEPVGDFMVQFLSPTEWVLRGPSTSEIRATSDGGATWTTASSTGMTWSDAPVFGSLQTGWLTTYCGQLPGRTDCVQFSGPRHLSVTRDGGVTWTLLGG